MGRQSNICRVKRKLRLRAFRRKRRQLIAGMSFFITLVYVVHAHDPSGRAIIYIGVSRKGVLRFLLSTMTTTQHTGQQGIFSNAAAIYF